ncbi:Alpha crystallin/Hsp20 domain [Arabidopsis thaliana x Arabidopsis arenosa]|uniref:Alpha crystallin/Hsp20 domain n=1 Tax=Arabidopsis thaliana x Arabidopsis arenosa TaxID=1240361 RepID=A0A8T2BP26_9BRAS|nr:Alpha crystallin/Hsp20 domain [Arabidopsis thaliana x Arabidopsis arenosa]
MELELGLKITRTKDDVSSSTDFRITSDSFGHLSLSRETNSVFFLILHLKGFKKDGIDIEINKEGNRIKISGRKKVEEMVLVKWVEWKKATEIKEFKKVFRIPEIVNLDKIKARFNEEDGTLTVTMRKKVKGITGLKIEEEEEVKDPVVEEKTEEKTEPEEEIKEEPKPEEEEEQEEAEEPQREEEEDKIEEEITRTREDVSSSVDFRFSKDPFGPLVLSRETDSRFIIIIHLKGFKKEGIEIDINEEGNRITIRGRKPVEEMVMIRWMAWRKEVEFRVFKKAFRIPDTVDLDMIKARFDDDDATLTITMPKRVKGISGFQIEEEEERVEFGDVSEVEHKEETEKGEFEEESIQRQESDVHSEKFETEFQKEEELVHSNKESEDSNLRKPPDIDGREPHEQTRHEEQENNQQLAQAESESDDFGSRAFEEIEEQEPDEQLDRTSESGATEKKTTGDDGDGLSKVQGIKKRERRNDERKIPEMVEEAETGDHEKKKVVKMEIKNRDSREEVDGKMGEGFRPNIDRPQVVCEDDIAETETKAEEFESDKLKADEVDKIHELVDKNEEEGEKTKVRRQSEDRNLRKLQENEEQHSKGQKRHSKEKKMKELVEEKTPEAETNTRNDILKAGQEIEVPEVDTLGKTGDERKEKQNIVKKETKSGDAKEEIDAKMGEVFASNNADTAMKSEDFESDKLESDEVDNIQKLVEKKDKQVENAKVGEQSEDSGSKLQEIGEQQIQGQKRHGKQEKIKELVDEQIPEAETNIENDILKPVLERSEGKHKIQKMFQEETKNQPETFKEKRTETGKKINEAGTRKVQEIIRQQERDEPTRSEKESKTRGSVKSKTNDEEKEGKETAGTERKEQESDRPKILREQEVAEDKTNFSKNGEVKEEEEIAEKKKEFGNDDDISRKLRDTDQRDSNAMKGQEEKDMIQELILEEKVCDGGKGIIAVAETKAENDKSKEVQEIEEQQFHKEDTCGKQFQKLKGGEVSGRGEVANVENEKKTIVAEKRIRDSTREAQDIEKNDSDASGKYIKETPIQELGENRGIYRNENEEEKKDKTDRPEKIIGTMKQELVSLNSQLEQDNVEDGEKTQELVEDKIKDCEEEEGSEESKNKTDDDVETKVQGIKEEELYEPKREHVSKIKELVEEKTDDYEKHEENEIAESEIEAECGSLRKVDGSEEQEFLEPKINKERDKTRITRAEEPSGQEKEEKEEKIAESMTITDNEKRYKIQEMVEAGHNGRKEEEQNENVTAEAELETERESSKKVQEIEQQKYERLKRSMVQDKMEETEGKEKTRAMKENEIVERKTKTKDGSLRNVRDDEDPELTKPYKRQKEDKKQDEKEILRSQGDLDEFERHCEQNNISKLAEEEKLENIAELEGKMEDDSSSKFHEFEERKSNEDWTHEEREKRKDLVKEEATDPKDKHTGGEDHIDHKEEQQKEKVIAKAELNIEEDSSKKVEEIEKQDHGELKRSMVQDKRQETEEKEKTRAMEKNETVERRKQTKEGSLGKLREGEDPELGGHERRGEEDRIQELVETEISDDKEIFKKKDTGKVDLGERERHSKQRKSHQSVEIRKGEGNTENISEPGGKMKGDTSGKFHEFQKQKSYEDYREEEECEETGNLDKEKATDLKDKHTGGEEEAAHTETKAEDQINEKVGEIKEQESEKQKGYEKDKLVLKEGATDREKEEGNIFEDFTTKIQQTKNEESHEQEMREKQQDIVPDFMEDETGDQEDEEAEEAAAVVASNENGNSNKVQTIKEHKKQNMIPETSDTEVKDTKQEVPNSRNVQETKELEAHFQEHEGKTENSKDDEGSKGDEGKQGKTVETMSRERFKTKSEMVRKIQETKVEESNEKKNHERKGKIEEPERKESSNHEVRLATEDDSLRKGQEFLEKESNIMSKRGSVEQDRIQEPKEAETKIDDGKSRKLEMSKLLELDESEEQKKKIQKSMEEKSNAPEIEKEGDEKIAEEEMQCKIHGRVKDKEVKGQEPYELLKNIEHEKIPEYHREEEKGMEQREIEEMKRAAEDVSSRECQDVEEKGSEQPKRYAEQEKLRELMTEEEGKEEYHLKQGEQNEKAKRILQVESKANDDSSKKNETKGQETTALRGENEKENHQRKKETIDECDSSRKIQGHEEERKMSEKLAEKETSHDDKEAKERNRAGVVWREEEPKVRDDGFRKARETEEKEQDKKQSDISGKAKENKNQKTKRRYDRSGNKAQEIEKQESHEQKRSEEEVFRRAETNDEYDSSRKIHEHGERKSDQLGEKLAEEETSNDKEAKEGNRAEPGLGEVEKKFGKVREIEEKEQDKKQSLETDISGKEKENKNQETKTRDDSSGKKIQKNEKQESHEQKRNEEQEKKYLGLVEKKKEEDETAEAEVPRNLKGIEKRESTKVVENHEHRDNIKELVQEKMNNHEGEDKKSMITHVLAKAKDDEVKVPEGLRKQDKSREQRLRDNLKDEKTAKTETKTKDNESRKIHQIKETEASEQERLKEQGRIKELVEDRTHFCREKENRETEFADGISKMIQEIGKEESIEPVDRETSEDDEEELEVEFEDEEEDWEAES